MSRHYRPKSPDINPDTGYPFDWDTDKQYQGVSRSITARRYVVRLSAANKQFSIGTATTQEEAARLYDLATWKLAAFVRHPRFNFSENFSDYSMESVRERAPFLDAFYDECMKLRPLSADLTEREHREAAFEPKAQPRLGPDARSNAGVYPRLTQAVAKASADALLMRNRITALRGKLKLNKLPTITQDLVTIEGQLEQLAASASKMFYALERHTSLYEAMQREEAQNDGP